MIDINKVHHTKNNGDLIVINYLNANAVMVKFLDTGFEVVTSSRQIKSGDIKDKIKPSAYGVGFIGNGKYKPTMNRIATKAYTVWRDMIRRCYSEKSLKKCPTYNNVSVCDEWHNFQNFAEWFSVNYIQGHELDKDIKIGGNKVYSPESCIFARPIDNIRKATAKNYELTSPEGLVVSINNLSEFCRGKGLHQANMCAVYHGTDKSYKGWTKC